MLDVSTFTTCKTPNESLTMSHRIGFNEKQN